MQTNKKDSKMSTSMKEAFQNSNIEMFHSMAKKAKYQIPKINYRLEKERQEVIIVANKIEELKTQIQTLESIGSKDANKKMAELQTKLNRAREIAESKAETIFSLQDRKKQLVKYL
jgi:archaellum component FlaC